MGFKVNTSFLRYLTMGALGTRRVMEEMQRKGFAPIELERYSTSNKIWMTKVKRLRLPDLICARTGQRIEVRAKSDLAIKMSDAPENPNRRWSSGLRPTDWVAFVQCHVTPDGQIIPAHSIETFQVSDLSACEARTKLGPPKSSSEGSERDREWASCVPAFDGEVLDISATRILTRNSATGRKQPFQLRGKVPYVRVGDHFRASEQFISALPRRKVELNPPATQFDPRTLLRSPEAIDRYAGCKILGLTGSSADINALVEIARSNTQEDRVRLEAAASAAKLGSEQGLDLLATAIDEPPIDYLRMEALLILPELKATQLEAAAADILRQCATDIAFEDTELRQAAIWGLGKAGLQRYDILLGFLDCEAENERIHTVTAFGKDVTERTACALVDVLRGDGSEISKASASYVLAKANIQGEAARRLVAMASEGVTGRAWALATLGQWRPEQVGPYCNEALMEVLEPLHRLLPSENWVRGPEALESVGFIEKQNL